MTRYERDNLGAFLFVIAAIVMFAAIMYKLWP